MDETMVSFYYQGYGLLIFYTCSIFFFQYFHTNAMVRFTLVKD